MSLNAYSPAEVAGFLGVHRLTIYRAMKRGDIKATRLGGRRLIAEDEVKRILSAAGVDAGVSEARPRKIRLKPAA